MFGATTPSEVTINSVTGTNNIQEAEAIEWTFYIKYLDLSREKRYEFEENYEKYVDSFNENSQYITVYSYTNGAINRQNDDDVERDIRLITIGVVVIIFLSFYILGSLNTYQSRTFVAVFGVVSVGIAYVEAMALGAICGFMGCLLYTSPSPRDS